MECFQSIFFFLMCFSFILLLEVITGAFGKASVTTFERQFQVDAKRAASLTIVYQICNLTGSLVISYLGKKFSRPRLIAIGCWLVVIGYFLASLPHFLAENYNYKLIEVGENATKKVGELCRVNSSAPRATTTAECHEVESRDRENQPNVTRMFWMMIAAYVLIGSGSSFFYPLGFSYIDDYAETHKSAAYIAFANAVMLAGNAAGFAVSGGILKLWVDFERVDTDKIDITNEDSRWIGAWWLCYPITGCLLFICSIMTLYFPRSMKVNEKKEGVAQSKESEELIDLNRKQEHAATDLRAGSTNKVPTVTNELGGCKGVLKTCKDLALSPVYVCIIISGAFVGGSQVSAVLFSPKYLEVSFGVSASRANFILGSVVLPCSALGITISGFIMKRWRLERNGALRLMLFAMICQGISGLGLFATGCETIDIRGITIPYSNQILSDISSPETNSCNKNCSCTTGSYSPVCGDDDVTYLSACHAGCKESTEEPTELDQPSVQYSNCSCVKNNESGEAISGRCLDSNCSHLFWIVVCLRAISACSSSMVLTPAMIVIFRSVSPEDKPVAIGVSSFLIRILGFLPSQIIVSSAIDTTCLYWSAGQCNTGFCKIYDNERFRRWMFGILLTYEVLSILILSIGCVCEWRERMRRKKFISALELCRSG